MAWDFAQTFGDICVQWVPTLELAIEGFQKVWKACPWIQTTRKAYNLKLMQTHLDALRLGFCSGEPFHVRDIGVHPLRRWDKMYGQSPQPGQVSYMHL